MAKMTTCKECNQDIIIWENGLCYHCAEYGVTAAKKPGWWTLPVAAAMWAADARDKGESHE